MTREEQIVQAGIEYTIKTRSMCIGGDTFSELVDKMNRNSDFEEGAKWADRNPNLREEPNLESLWHNSSEEPKGDDWKVLCQDKYGTYFIVEYRPYDSECDITWDEYTNSLFISKWAYITDLLPKGGEK